MSRRAASAPDAYGEQLLERLGTDMSARFGRGFSRQNLQSMRVFYTTYGDEIRQTLSGKSGGAKNRETTSGNSDLARLPFPAAGSSAW